MAESAQETEIQMAVTDYLKKLSRVADNWKQSLSIPRLFIRLAVIFGALISLKAIGWFNSSRYLFENYWRGNTPPITAANYVFFAGFALLVGALIWILARNYDHEPLRKHRFLNGLISLSALVFIFSSFHEADTSHLQAVCRGTLAVSDLGSYYSLNFFFRPPYLAVWMAVYAISYWLLMRQQLERFGLRLTAIFGGAYILLCLEQLLNFRNELLLLDIIGSFCLINLWRKASLKLRLGLLPLMLMATGYFAWFSYEKTLAALPKEFLFVFVTTFVLFGSSAWVARRVKVDVGWSWCVLFGGLTFLLLLNAFYPMAGNLRKAIYFSLTLPRYFLGEILTVGALLVLGHAYLRKWPKGNLLWLDVASVVIILASLIDLRLVQIMGARLDWDMVSLGLGEGVKIIWRLAQPYLTTALVALTGLVGGYALLVWGGQKAMARKQARASLNRNWGFQTFALLILLALMGRFSLKSDKVVGGTLETFAWTVPVKTWLGMGVMNSDQFHQQIGLLKMVPSSVTSDAELMPSTPKDLNVVFVLLESTYNKYLSLFNGHEETQPLLSQYRERMELFPNFYSSFAGSINARFACYSGLYPVGDYKQFTNRRIPVKTLFEILHEHGWENSVFYSSHFDYTGFRGFLSARHISGMYDADTMPGERKSDPVSWGLREEETLTAMQEYLRQQAKSSARFFMSYIPAAPHYPYDGTPECFKKFPDAAYGDFTPRYLNDLLYMDWVVSSILDELKATGLLDKTLVVITGDHGEMLGENGGPIGHGWRLTPELANVPLIILDPTRPEPAINYTVGSQVDLLPTILDKLGIPLPENQMYQGVSLYSSAAARERTIYLNSYSQYAVIQGKRMSFGERGNPSSILQYSITNSGARSEYVELHDSKGALGNMTLFDDFQGNFLKHYDHYRSLLIKERTSELAASEAHHLSQVDKPMSHP